jgi:hypothetical protein
MKKIIPGLFVLCFSGTCYAQSFDDLMLKKRYVTCLDVSYNAPDMIHALYKNNQLDSLYSFLDYWQNKCGKVEYAQVIQVLLDIKTANFDSATVTPELFGSLMAYKESDRFSYHHRFGFNNEFIQIQENIRNQAKMIALAIQQTYSVDESLLQDFYAADSVTFNTIKTASPEASTLKKLYDQKVTETLRLPEFHGAAFLGYYQPFGKLDVFGPHPSIGLLCGVRQLRHTLDLVLDIRFGRSENEYEFIYQGNLLKDDTWTSAYFGLEYTYDFIQSRKIRVGISPGLAYNGITAVTADEDHDDDAKILPGYDVNGGIAFKYAFGKKGYLGLQTRYHWVDHRNPGGTELNGNYLSVRLIVGSIFNYDRDHQLGLLDY